MYHGRDAFAKTIPSRWFKYDSLVWMQAKRQIKLIFELLGTPNENYIKQFPDEKVQSNLRKVVSEVGNRKGIPME